MHVKSTEEIISYLTPYAQALGAEISDAEWQQRKNELSLTVFLEAEKGVDLNLLEAFHHAVDAPLDELDPTFGAPYTLNCSSPGLDRPFKTERDYLRRVGETVEIRLYAPQDGKKEFTGTLLGLENGEAVLKAGEKEMRFPLSKIAKACLLIEI